MAEIVQKILQIEKDMAAAFNRREMDAILQYFDEPISGFSSTKHERLRDLEDLRKTFAYYLQVSEYAGFEIGEIHVQVFGNVAIATFYWSVTLKIEGEEHEVPGRGSHVFVERNGAWKIIHEHFSRAHHQPELWDTSLG